MGGNENATKVVLAAVKLPSFYMMIPCFWFIQAEGQFATKGVEDGATKFHYVVGALPQDVALRVMPVEHFFLVWTNIIEFCVKTS